MQCRAMQCQAMQRIVKQCTTMLRNAKQLKAMHTNEKQCKSIQTMQSNARQRKQSQAMQCTAMHTNAKHCKATQVMHCDAKAMQNNALQWSIQFQCKAVQSNAKHSRAKPREGRQAKTGQGTRGWRPRGTRISRAPAGEPGSRPGNPGFRGIFTKCCLILCKES